MAIASSSQSHLYSDFLSHFPSLTLLPAPFGISFIVDLQNLT